MPIENKKEVKEFQQSDHDRDTESTTAQPDIEDYQQLHRDEHYVVIPGSGGDMAQDLVEVGTLCSDEVLDMEDMDPILKIKWVVKNKP